MHETESVPPMSIATFLRTSIAITNRPDSIVDRASGSGAVEVAPVAFLLGVWRSSATTGVPIPVNSSGRSAYLPSAAKDKTIVDMGSAISRHNT